MSGHTRCPSGVAVVHPTLEVADIFRRHLDDYRQLHALTEGQQDVTRDLVVCRTPALGGHLDRCTNCGFETPAYNSFRNRHSPKCQALDLARWVESCLQRILPVHYFHLVFTLPSELHSLAYNNRAAIFALLFRSAADTLLTLAADPKWLGKDAQLGITAVLHTWTRELCFHPHVHCIVTGGGLAHDKSQWVPAPRDFLFPVHIVGALFRGKFMAGLEVLLREGKLHDDVPDRAAHRRRQRLYKTSWIVYAKRPFGGPEQVFRYLGRYTHRVAISNARLVSMDDNAVVFRTRGSDTASLSPTEFIGKFLQHILPSRFVKIRHFGLMSSGNVNRSLEQARALLPTVATDSSSAASDGYDEDENVPSARPIDPDLPWPALLLALTGQDVLL
jgi:Putative transposase/Transposase zinc-binding domain